MRFSGAFPRRDPIEGVPKLFKPRPPEYYYKSLGTPSVKFSHHYTNFRIKKKLLFHVIYLILQNRLLLQ